MPKTSVSDLLSYIDEVISTLSSKGMSGSALAERLDSIDRPSTIAESVVYLDKIIKMMPDIGGVDPYTLKWYKPILYKMSDYKDKMSKKLESLSTDSRISIITDIIESSDGDDISVDDILSVLM